MLRVILIILLLSLSPSFVYSEDVVICKKGTVGIGDTIGFAISKCGQPISKERRQYYDSRGNRGRTIIVDEVTFEISSDRNATLMFYQGRLMKIIYHW
jgi:hypothetical protein